MLEKLAYSFGLGMMAVGALTLGVKLCGFSGRGLVLMVTGISAVIGFWRNYQTMMSGLASGLREMLSNPFALVVGFVFLLIFRLAAFEGLLNTMRWPVGRSRQKFFTSTPGAKLSGGFPTRAWPTPILIILRLCRRCMPPPMTLSSRE